MVRPWKSGFSSLLLVGLTALAALLTPSCLRPPQLGDNDGEVEPTGEPEQYSATVVRTVDDGTRREVSITRQARSGEKRREEWIEQGQNRALIWRPDLGKAFLLDLDRRTYVEIEVAPGHGPDTHSETENLDSGSSGQHTARGDIEQGLAEAIDREFDEAPSATRVETRMLRADVIDGRPCRVYERRAAFGDGHIEVTRTFRALDLAGLAVRIEAGAEQGTTSVTTERRDVRIEVGPDAFNVPPNFKKVEKLARLD